MRDVSRCGTGRAGKLSKSTAARICAELRERFAAFGRRDLYDIDLAALFLDASFSASARRAQGGRAGRLGLHRGRRAALFAVMLGMRESTRTGSRSGAI